MYDYPREESNMQSQCKTYPMNGSMLADGEPRPIAKKIMLPLENTSLTSAPSLAHFWWPRQFSNILEYSPLLSTVDIACL